MLRMKRWRTYVLSVTNGVTSRATRPKASRVRANVLPRSIASLCEQSAGANHQRHDHDGEEDHGRPVEPDEVVAAGLQQADHIGPQYRAEHAAETAEYGDDKRLDQGLGAHVWRNEPDRSE